MFGVKGNDVSRRSRRWMPRKCRLPLFFDYITDRVRNRYLSNLLIILIFLWVLDLVIVNNLRDPMITSEGIGRATIMDVFVWPSSPALISTATPIQPQVQLRREGSYYPVEGEKVIISLSRI